MYKNKKIIGIIPARGGSKGVPGKNIKMINGKPLISWTVEAAKLSKFLDRIFVSTDSKKIRDISINLGLDVPFLRPPIFSQDNSPSWEAVVHALDEFKKINQEYDYVALLEPTSPLRKQNDIDNAIIKIINNKDAESLVSLGEIHMEHPKIVKKINSDNFVEPYIKHSEDIFQRQQMDNAYFPYGVIYLSSVISFYQNKKFYSKKTIPYFIERWQNYELDDMFDFEIIENILNKYEAK